MHQPLKLQQVKLRQKLLGHYGYYVVTSNYRGIARFLLEARRTWFYWLRRRAQRRTGSSDWFRKLLEKYPLPKPKIMRPSILKRSETVT
jgi:hypothetical protein